MKKIFIAMILFFIGVTFVSASSDILYIAEKIPNIYIRKISSDGTEIVKQGGFLRRKSDNSFVYCVEPFASLKNNYSYSSFDEDHYVHLGIPQSTWNKISLIAYYGYQYGSHLEDYWYYVTQIMIWRAVDEKAQFYFTSTLGGENDPNLFANEIAEIENLVNNHLKVPRLDLEDILYGETKKFSDKENVLSNYTTNSENVVISDNDLIVTGNTLGTNTINLKRVSNNYETVPIVYIDSEGQNVIAVGNLPDINTTITLNVIENKIKVIKVSDENNPLQGVTFALYDELGNVLDIQVTDKFGTISFIGLKTGNYVLKELATIDGYILDNEEYEIELNGEEEITITNKYQTGNLEILKVDSNNNPIFETEFTLYDENNNKLGVYTTDENGKILVENLKLGSYFLEETKANTNYHLLEDIIEFEITKNKELVSITVTNELITIDVPNTNINFKLELFILPNNKNKFENI